MKKVSILIACILLSLNTKAQSEKKISKVIDQIPAIVDLLKNKELIQNVLHSGQGIEKGAIYNYLITVNASPKCARLDSLLQLQKDFYINVDEYNNLIGEMQDKINQVTTMQDIKDLGTKLKPVAAKFPGPIKGLVAINSRSIMLSRTVGNCEMQNWGILLKVIGDFLLNDLLPYLRDNQIAKLKIAINSKLEMMKIDKMEVLWKSTISAVQNQQPKPFSPNNMLVVALPNDSTAAGQVELTFESSARELELVLTDNKRCFSKDEINNAFKNVKDVKLDLWNDRDFYTTEQAKFEKNRLVLARNAMLFKYKCID